MSSTFETEGTVLFSPPRDLGSGLDMGVFGHELVEGFRYPEAGLGRSKVVSSSVQLSRERMIVRVMIEDAEARNLVWAGRYVRPFEDAELWPAFAKELASAINRDLTERLRR